MTGFRWRTDLLLIGALFILPLVMFWQVTVGDKTLLPADNLYQFAPWSAYADELEVGTPQNSLVSDLLLENYAWKNFIRQAIRQRELPLWNPYLFAGVPFLAAGQHSALYPFSLIYYVMPLAKAYGWFTVSQLWLAGVTMYVLMRVLKVGRWGALLSAVVYQLGGFLVIRAVFPMMIAGAAWLPLELAMIELTVERRAALGGRATRLPWVVIGAIGLGMVALAGHVEIFYYTLLVMAFYAGWRLVARLVSREESWRGSATGGGWLLVMVGLGLALGAIQTVPLIELGQVNFREGAATLAEIRTYAYPPRQALAFVMPNVFGSPGHQAYFDLFKREWVEVTVNALGERITFIDWGVKNYVEGAAYLGILPLLLAVIGVARGIKGNDLRSPWLFTVLAGVSLLLAFGTPLYGLLYYGLPFVNQLHSPFRWVWPFALAVAVLAGFGADALARRNSAGQFRIAGWLGWGALLAGAGGLITVTLTWLMFDRLEGLFERSLTSLALANRAFADGKALFSFEALQVGIFGMMMLLSGAVLLVWRSGYKLSLPLRGNKRLISIGGILGVALIITDLMLASWGFHSAADPALLQFEPPVIEFLAQDEGLWRFTTYEEPGANTFIANTGWYYNFSDVRGYDSLIPKQYADYMEVIAPQSQLAHNRIAPIFSDMPQALESPLLDLLGVKYIITESEITTPGIERVYADETGIAVYENTRALPRAFTLPLNSTVLTNDFARSAQEKDVRHFVLVDNADEPFNVGEAQRGEPGPASITAYRLNEVWVDVEVDEESWLVLTDSYFNGWRAFIRPIGADDSVESELEVVLVNGNFRGVVLPQGRHTVRMKYSPDSIKLGAFASFMAMASIVFALGVWLWRYRVGDGEGGSAVQRVAKNSLAPIVLNLFNRSIDFAFALVMLRILRPEGAGNYTTAIVIWGWFEILTNFGLNTFLTREVARQPEDTRRYLFNTSLLRIGLALLGIPLMAGFLALFQASIDPPLTVDTLVVIGLLYIGLLPGSLSTGLSALFYAFEKAEHPATITTISTMLKASLGLAALLVGAGIVGLAGVAIVVNMITLTILLALAWRTLPHLRQKAPLRIDWKLQQHMLGESFPLMINHLLATLFFRIDVVLLQAFRGPATVGRYSTSYKWLDALNIIPAFFTLAMFPVMSRQAREDRPGLLRAYVLSIKLMVSLALPAAVGITALARALIGLLGGSEYLPDGAVALQLIIWSIPVGWINSVTQYVLIALDRQRILTRAFVVGVVFNVGTNLIFMPVYGFRAAAILTFFSELTLLVAFYLTLRRALADARPAGQRQTVPWLHILWRPVLATAVMAAAVLGMLSLGLGALLAVLVGGLVYLVALVVVRPFTAEEVAQIEPLIPGKLRGKVTAALRWGSDAA